VEPVTDEAEPAGPGRLRAVIGEDSVLLLAGLTKLLEGAEYNEEMQDEFVALYRQWRAGQDST
jgi:hypothetical protein